jgi:hypothetical protein
VEKQERRLESKVATLEGHKHVSGRVWTVGQATDQRKSLRSLLASDQPVTQLANLFKVAKSQSEWLTGLKKVFNTGSGWSMRREEGLRKEGNWCHLQMKKRKIVKGAD